MHPRARLRWQLTFSHLAAIAVTLVAMVAAAVLLTGLLAAIQQDPQAEPAIEARQIAAALGGLVVQSGSPSDLNVVLRAIVGGGLRMSVNPGPNADLAQQRFDRLATARTPYVYAAIVSRDGQVMASSAPAGVDFAPPERGEWMPLVRSALDGPRPPRQLVALRPGRVPAALGVAPILDDQGRAVAAVVVASQTLGPPDRAIGFWRGLALFSAVSILVLAAASLFALLSASLVAYRLSRRLVDRLERLGQSAEALAAGDLSARVAADDRDELGQLAGRFNAMAERLTTTVADLEAARQQAQHSLDANRALVANLSHELRTPLALIQGHVETLQLRGTTSPTSRHQADLAIVRRETEHLSGLINDLLTLATAEAGALPLSLAPVVLDDVIAEVADSIRPLARRERQVSLVTQVMPALPPVLADRRRVVQILANLVRNALRHTPSGGLIALRAEMAGERVAVSVEDTGEGIAADQLPHIFERFYRGDQARDRGTGGVGLGLAIVRELAEAMGGNVTATSTLGQGSRFTVSLPIVPTADRAGPL